MLAVSLFKRALVIAIVSFVGACERYTLDYVASRDDVSRVEKLPDSKPPPYSKKEDDLVGLAFSLEPGLTSEDMGTFLWIEIRLCRGASQNYAPRSAVYFPSEVQNISGAGDERSIWAVFSRDKVQELEVEAAKESDGICAMLIKRVPWEIKQRSNLTRITASNP